MNDEFVIDGFTFANEEEYLIAKEEKKKIAYIESKINYKDINTTLSLYNKLITEMTFKSPVGLFYIKRLYDYLDTKREYIDFDIIPIPFELTRIARKRLDSTDINLVKDAENKKESIALAVSVILNILLVLAVAAMFVLAIKSDSPNILNYEQAIENKYSSWEQELRERERLVRERESIYFEEGVNEHGQR